MLHPLLSDHTRRRLALGLVIPPPRSRNRRRRRHRHFLRRLAAATLILSLVAWFIAIYHLVTS